MNFSAIATAVVVLGLVWGGLIYFLIKAFSYERLKRNGER